MADEERPQYQHGVGTIGGTQFHWGSGSPGQYWSIPYGDYPVTPNAPTGDWAHRVGAIPIANNVIPDPLLGRNRIGIMIHSGSASSLDALYTQGCFKVAPQEWPAVRAEILKEASNGPLYLHVAPGGVAAFTNTKTFSQAGDETPAANANATANTSASGNGPAIASAPAKINPGLAINSSPLAGSHSQFIQDYAKSIGLDPNLALGIANAEGLRAWSASNPNAASTVDIQNGQPFSFGDFQLNVRNGLGTEALRHNIDPRDASQWQAADKFALDQMKSGGLGPWKGDPYAEAYLKSGAAPAVTTPEASGPIDPSIIARGGTSPPIPTTPGTTINSNPIASLGGKIEGLATNLQKDLGKSDDSDKEQAKPDIKSNLPPAPGARNVSPLLGNPQLYAQRMAGLNQPMTWGGAPPGQMAGTGFGVQAQPSVYGTSLMSNQQRSLDPMWMNSWDG